MAATAGSPILPAEEFIVRSKFAPVVFKNGNVTKYLFDSFPTWNDAIALECGETDEKASYSDLKERAYNWGGFLTQLGLSKGDVIGLVSPNCLDLLPMILGTAAIGVIVSTYSNTMTSGEMANLLSINKPTLVVYFEALEDVVKEALKKASLEPILIPMQSIKNKQNLREILRGEVTPIAGPIELTGEECFVILFSSGTTGLPKPIAISHNAVIRGNQILSNPANAIARRGSELHQDVMLLTSPIVHIGGLLYSAFALINAFKLVVLSKIDEENIMAALKRKEVTFLSIMTAILNVLANRPDFNCESTPSLEAVFAGGSIMPEALAAKVKTKLMQNVKFFELYGMTETYTSHFAVEKGGKTQPLYGVEGLILDVVTRKPLPRNEAGEICVRTPGSMMYYVNNPKATRQIFTEDGWIISGDFGFYDNEGYLHVTDRLKNVIKVGVHQVLPGEIEGVLLQHPAVAECCVIRVKHEQQGEAPLGLIVKKGPLEEDEVREFLLNRLSKQKQLNGGIIFLEELPKISAGKVDRKELQTKYT